MRSAPRVSHVFRVKTIPLLPILIATVVLVLPFHLRPDNFIVDDGYFYPQIARAIAQGQGSTFNRIMPTNGYHPLWMLVCVVGAWFTVAPAPLVQVLTLVQDGLTLLSLAILVTIAFAAEKRGAVAGCAVVLFFSAVLGIWRLLEANLAFLLQLIVLTLVVPIFPSLQRKLGRWHPVVVGFLLGLTLLARLDLIFFVMVALAYGFLHRESPTSVARRIGPVAVQGALALLLVAPYLIWNVTQFHHLQPISGAIKSTFPHLQSWVLPTYALPVVGAFSLSAMSLIKRERSCFDELCLVAAVAGGLHLCFTLSFGGLAPWYLTTGYLCVSLCAISVADWLLAALPKLGRLEYSFSMVVFLVFLSLSSLRLFSNFTYTRLIQGDISFNKNYVEPKRALAEKLRETLPGGSRIFVFDAPGAVAFYSGMSILPSDGLVADYAYNADLVSSGFARYAAQHHVDYIIAPYLRSGQTYDRLSVRSERTRAGQVVSVQAPLTRQNAGNIILYDQDLLFRFPEINPELEGVYREIGVWRIQHASQGPSR